MRTSSCIMLFLAFIFIAGVGHTQVLPLKGTQSLLVGDSSNDKVWRMTDLNLDGDLNDVDEVITFYDGSNSGIPIGNPTCVTVDPAGFVYVVDSTNKVVVRLYDLNGDGDANEAAEASIWLDNTNGSGITLGAINTLAFLPDGSAYLSQAGISAAPEDVIYYCKDLNGDYDVNDAGEISLFYDATNGSPDIVMEVPQGIALDADGILYCTDAKSGIQKVVRMEDLDGNGNVNDPGETTIYYNGSGSGTPLGFTWTLSFTQDGGLLMSDTTNDVILLGYDLNDDKDLEDPGEVFTYREKEDPPGLERPKTCWGIAVAGTSGYFWDFYGVDNYGDDVVLGMRDKNSDGDAQDPGETEEIFCQTVSPSGAKVRSCGFMEGPYLVRQGDPIHGTTVDFVLTSTVNDDYAIFLSLAALPGGILVAPYGRVEILPPFLLLQQGTIPLEGEVTMPVPIPNSPNLVGFSFYVQAIAGTDYLSTLSNMVPSTIQ